MNSSFLQEGDARTGMVCVPAGQFSMGSESGGEFERPVHEVELDEFLIDETLVTNRQFDKFIQATGYITDAERQALVANIGTKLVAE